MSSTTDNDSNFRAQSYLRLLKYTVPYWKRLTFGILCGMLVGGSLFFALLLVPQLVGLVDSGGNIGASADQRVLTPDELGQLREIAASPDFSDAEKDQLIKEFMTEPPDDDPKLTRLLSQAKSVIERFHLPCAIEGKTIRIDWPVRKRFDIVTSDGRIAWQLFAIYIASFVLVWTLRSVGMYLNGYFTRYVGIRVVADMRDAIFKKLTNQSLRFYGDMDVGHLISRCTNDTSALEYSVSHSIEDLTNAPLQILGCVAAIVVACRQFDDYVLVILLGLGLGIIVIPIVVVSRIVRKYYKRSFARIADVFSRMHEVFSGIRAVKAYYAEERENRRFNEVNRKYYRQAIKAMRLHIMFTPLMEMVGVTSTLIFLLYSYKCGITVTELAALLTPAMMAFRPIKDISKVFASLQQSMAAADRYFALLDTDTSLPEKADAVELKEFKQGITVRDVCFSYDDRVVLDHVSFDIPHGSMVAVVGETGSGKSTIANLLARFYDVDSGSIAIDGVDIRDFKIASLRRMIGVVNQDAIMFNETIGENIAYGKPEASMDEIIAAAKLANAHEFIVNGPHPKGYDTEVGEKGFKLSGGEKQRVSIARAILRNPPILILDEATSALDTVTEKLVQEALNRVMSNRTVFAIAHRLSTIRNADMILVMQNGRIVEFGKEADLLARENGIYRRLHTTQFSQ
ncbi:MAG: ABC transporter ATP-binding protein [Lentisphaeria bacterium]|nr:ABC transporter ATP-binding protein [Lentisphaeria bacterium]